MTSARTDGFVQAGPLRLHYERWGEGPRVVVGLHGTSLHGRVWAWLAERFPREFSFFGLDQRGHGDSDGARPGEYTVDFYRVDFERAADALGLARFSIVGSSLGSRVALAYAAAHPDRVERLVFLDLSFEMPTEASEEMVSHHLSRPRTFADMDEALAFSKTLPQRMRFTEATHRRTLEGDLRRNAEGRLEWRYDRDAAIETLRVAARDMWAEVRGVRAPVLILRGATSNVLLPATIERALREFADVKVVEIAGAGHSIWGDNPEATAGAILEFLLVPG